MPMTFYMYTYVNTVTFMGELKHVCADAYCIQLPSFLPSMTWSVSNEEAAEWHLNRRFLTQ